MRATWIFVVAVAAPRMAATQGLFEEAMAGNVDADPEVTADDNGEVFVLPETLELGGYVRGDLFVGKDEGVDASELKSGYAELSLQARARAGTWGDAFGELRLKSGLEWGERVTDVSLREAYMNLFLGRVDLRVGRQVVAWGRADGFNPTDNLTPRDMNVRSANEDDRRVANMAVRAWINVRPARLELVWVPFFEPSRFPNFALPGPLSLVDPDYPDQNLTKGIGAARLNLETAAFEGSLSYLVGHATFPGLRLHGVTIGTPPPIPPPIAIEAGFSAYRHQVIGFDFAATLGDWLGLRGEVAYQRPFDGEARDDVPLANLAYVLGFDGEPITNVSIIAQYVGRYAFDWEELVPSRIDELSEAFPLGEALAYPGGPQAFAQDTVHNEIRHKVRAIYNQQEQISHAASLRVAWITLHDTLTLEVLGYYGFTMGDYMVRPKISYAIADAINLYVGAEIYGGGDDTLYGLVDQTLSAGFAELRASF